jgi:hypothetical protein
MSYVRVSHLDQNREGQFDRVQTDKLFSHKASGRGTQQS